MDMTINTPPLLINITEDELYAMAFAEIQNDKQQSGIWAKALAESMGDNQRAKASYIRIRTEQLIHDQIATQIQNGRIPFKCPLCGRPSAAKTGQLQDCKRDNKWIFQCPDCHNDYDIRQCLPEGTMRVLNINSEQRSSAIQDSFTFTCIACKQQLRVTLPISDGYYLCPGCKTRYHPVKSSALPYVFVLVPENQKSKDGQTPPQRAHVIPKEVRSALSMFDLAETATAEDAKRAYRHSVHQYHPDKVAHLGPDLRKVAEQKTMEYVAAFEVLDKYFSENSK